MYKSLTPRQKEIVDFIVTFQKQHSYSPSLEEIAKGIGVSAVSTVHKHLKLISNKGYLSKSESQPRGINPIANNDLVVEVPVLGVVTAGEPIEAYEEPQPLMIPTNLISNPKGHYALLVEGDSMIDDDVWSGDIILVKHQQHASKGDMIIAVSDNQVTLKRYGGIEGDMAKLIPRNPNMEAFYVDVNTFEIRGVFAGLIRRNVSDTI